MNDKLLITQDDIKLFRPTADLDDNRINPFILEAQINDLKPILNGALYLDFIKKFDDQASGDYTKYRDLLYGKEYTYNDLTIPFDGVRPMLSYYALARFIASNPINITRLGVVVKRTENSDPADPALIRGVVNELRSTAASYQSHLIDFLCRNSTTYPLYQQGGSSSNNAKRIPFNSFKL